MIRCLVLLIALLPFSTLAKQCPNKENLPDLCMFIATHSSSAGGYERIISEAACVDQADNEALRAKKIGQMWQTFGDALICNNIRFNVRDGNVLKAAVSSRYEDFLFDAVCVWQVDLNRIDPWDASTVLDYTFDEYLRLENQPNAKTMKRYYELLRFGCGSGKKTIVARHRAELCKAGGPMPEGCKHTDLRAPPCGSPGRPKTTVTACNGYDYYAAMGTTFEAYEARRAQLLRQWMSGNTD